MGLGSWIKKAVPKEIRPGTSGFTTAAGIGSLIVPEIGALALGNALLMEWAPGFIGKQIRQRISPVLTPVASSSPTQSTVTPTPQFGGVGFGNTGGIPMRLLMPPGGFEGAAQQSAAVRVGLAKASGRKGGKRSSAARRRKKNGAAKSAKRRRSTSAKRGGKSNLKKGSAAAKAWGAKMKRLRKR